MLSVQAPAFTFGSKPTNNSAQIRDAPGPADYSPTKSTKAPSYSLTGRNFVKEASSHGTPGPGAYSVKTTSKHTHKGPSPSVFSMGKRIPQGGKYTPNPGPADYSLDRTFKGTTGSPRFSPDKHSRRGNALHSMCKRQKIQMQNSRLVYSYQKTKQRAHLPHLHQNLHG